MPQSQTAALPRHQDRAWHSGRTVKLLFNARVIALSQLFFFFFFFFFSNYFYFAYGHYVLHTLYIILNIYYWALLLYCWIFYTKSILPMFLSPHICARIIIQTKSLTWLIDLRLVFFNYFKSVPYSIIAKYIFFLNIFFFYI